MNVQLWEFVRAHGVHFNEVLSLLLGLIAVITGVWMSWDALRTPHAHRTYGSFVYPALGFAIGLLLIFGSRYLVRERYLREPGGGRYTVATVVGHDTWRGLDRFTCAYHVGGQPYRTQQECGIAHGQDLPCPPLQARRFVVFAPEDPSTAQILATPVPDTLRHVPATGWARLP